MPVSRSKARARPVVSSVPAGPLLSYHTPIADLYQARIESASGGLVTVRLAFGPEPATNEALVPAALEALKALPLEGGEGIRFTGPASLPVAMALAHAVAHRYGYVACWDPKLTAFVVAISHHPHFHPGQLLP